MMWRLMEISFLQLLNKVKEQKAAFNKMYCFWPLTALSLLKYLKRYRNPFLELQIGVLKYFVIKSNCFECLAASCPQTLTYIKYLYGCGITGNNHSYNFRTELRNKKPLLIKCTVLASNSFELIEISFKI